MQFRNDYTLNTANQIQELVENKPRILKWLFDEMQESIEDEDETQRKMIREFEIRKLDTKYHQMLDTREKNNLRKMTKTKAGSKLI